jgi:hypothetical protein
MYGDVVGDTDAGQHGLGVRALGKGHVGRDVIESLVCVWHVKGGGRNESMV